MYERPTTTDGDRRAAAAAAHDDPPALLSAPLSFKEQTNATDLKLMDLLWGKDKVRSARNEQVRGGLTCVVGVVRACVRRVGNGERELWFCCADAHAPSAKSFSRI